MTIRLDVTHIRTNGGTQPRAQLDPQTVADYAEDMINGATFPPVVAFYDGTAYWLADGFHRLAAAQRVGWATITTDVRQGTLEDARWYSYSVNHAHGLRRTNEDKRRAVEAALQHTYSSRYSNREIARHCGVSSTFVDIQRRTSANELQIDVPAERTVTRNGTPYTMNTANIGKAAPVADSLVAIVPIAADPPTTEPILTSDDWYTPLWLITLVRLVLGRIDLDPATCEAAQTIIQAARYYTKEMDGLAQPWEGCVYLNPPYSDPTKWVQKLVDGVASGAIDAGILLLNTVNSPEWTRPLWYGTGLVCLLDRRVGFSRPQTGETKGGDRDQMLFLIARPEDTIRRRLFCQHFGAKGAIWQAVAPLKTQVDVIEPPLQQTTETANSREADIVVDCLRSAVSEAVAGLKDVPGLLRRTIDEDLWRERVILRTGEVQRFDRFIDFVTAQPLEGLGSDIATLKRLCRDDMVLLTAIERLL